MKYIDDYLKWIRDNSFVKEIKTNTHSIVMPFLDRNNDFIELFVINCGNDTFKITDDGETIDELSFSGFNIFDGKNKERLFKSIVRAHGITFDNKELFIIANSEQLPVAKHLMFQCIMKLNDMFFISRENTASLFIEDVRSFLNDKNIRYVADISISGKSNLPSHYDFVIAKSEKADDRFIKVINRMDNTKAKSIIFEWDDTQSNREDKAVLFTFIKDKDKRVNNSILTAFKNYNITPALWSERDKYTDRLVA